MNEWLADKAAHIIYRKTHYNPSGYNIDGKKMITSQAVSETIHLPTNSEPSMYAHTLRKNTIGHQDFRTLSLTNPLKSFWDIHLKEKRTVQKDSLLIGDGRRIYGAFFFELDPDVIVH